MKADKNVLLSEFRGVGLLIELQAVKTISTLYSPLPGGGR